MAKIELEISDRALENAQKYAEASFTTLEALLSAWIEIDFKEPIKPSTTHGLFANEPELVDQVMEYVREARQNRAGMKETTIEADAA